MKTIDKNVIYNFYKQYDIEFVPNHKYYNIYEVFENKCYPKFTSDKFIQMLNVCWGLRIDMNFDHDGDWDNETMIYRRDMSYEQSVLLTMTEDFPIYLDDETYNTLRYEVRRIFND